MYIELQSKVGAEQWELCNEILQRCQQANTELFNNKPETLMQHHKALLEIQQMHQQVTADIQKLHKATADKLGKMRASIKVDRAYQNASNDSAAR